jgi:hypothetical protein
MLLKKLRKFPLIPGVLRGFIYLLKSGMDGCLNPPPPEKN